MGAEEAFCQGSEEPAGIRPEVQSGCFGADDAPNRPRHWVFVPEACDCWLRKPLLLLPPLEPKLLCAEADAEAETPLRNPPTPVGASISRRRPSTRRRRPSGTSLTALSALSHPLTSSSASGIGAAVDSVGTGGLDAIVAYDEAILVCIGTSGLGIRADSFLFTPLGFSFGSAPAFAFVIRLSFASFGDCKAPHLFFQFFHWIRLTTRWIVVWRRRGRC